MPVSPLGNRWDPKFPLSAFFFPPGFLFSLPPSGGLGGTEFFFLFSFAVSGPARRTSETALLVPQVSLIFFPLFL